MTNREVFMKVFPVVFTNKKYPNFLEWIDNKGKQEILCDIFDATFGDAEYQGPLDGDYVSREKVKEILRSGVSLDLDEDKDYVCDLIDKLPGRV